MCSSDLTLDLNSFVIGNAISNNGGTILNGTISGSVTANSGTTSIDTGLAAGSSLVVGSGATAIFGNGSFVSGSASILNNGGLIVDRTTNALMQLAAPISGSGGLTVSGGVVDLSGVNDYTGLTQVSNLGSLLKVNGSIAGDVQVGSGAMLGGSGAIAGVLSGAGIVSPGNSPGILTASQFDPTLGLGAAFEFTALNPVYGSPTASLNDVLRLTGSSAFASNLTSSNAIDIYFNVDSIKMGDIFEGGFFTGLSASDLMLAVQNAHFNYWVKDSGGLTLFGGNHYSSLFNVPGITSVTVQTAARTADFGGGNITGSVTQFVIVPEPGALALAGIGIAAAAYAYRRRRS